MTESWIVTTQTFHFKFDCASTVKWRTFRRIGFSHLIHKQPWFSRKEFRLKLDSSVKYDTCCTEHAERSEFGVTLTKKNTQSKKTQFRKKWATTKNRINEKRFRQRNAVPQRCYILFICLTFFYIHQAHIFLDVRVSLCVCALCSLWKERPFFSSQIFQYIERATRCVMLYAVIPKHATVNSCENRNVSFVPFRRRVDVGVMPESMSSHTFSVTFFHLSLSLCRFVHLIVYINI